MRFTSTLRAQRGVATLAIVAILFFIVALVAAYTNRNLIFEQRTAGNQWRSTLALEAAEGGVEWTLSLLNSGRIQDGCRPSDDPLQPSFRERFLVVNPAGMVAPIADRQFACVSNGEGGWTCDCTADATPAPAAPAGDGIYPAFRGRFTAGSRPGVVTVQINGCTRLDDRCLAFPAAAVSNEGRASLEVVLALRNAVPAAPAAAVTVRGELSGVGTLNAYSPDAAAGSLAVLTGGSVTVGSLNVGSAPGSPADDSRLVQSSDPVLSGEVPGADRMFASTFAVWPAAFRDQPGAVRMACEDGCTGDDVRSAIALNPGRVVWITGDVALDGPDDIGSVASPVVIVVDGVPSIETDIFGLVYVRQPDPDDLTVPWSAAGTGSITGALIVEGALDVVGNLTVVHDHDLLGALRRGTGSFVRVPGGWADFSR